MLSDLESHKSFGERTLGAVTGKLQQLAASAARDPNAPIANGWLIFYFSLIFAVLIFVVGGVREWHHGSGEGSFFVDVVWRVTWIIFSVLEVALIVLLAIWGYRRFISGREERSD